MRWIKNRLKFKVKWSNMQIDVINIYFGETLLLLSIWENLNSQWAFEAIAIPSFLLQ